MSCESGGGREILRISWVPQLPPSIPPFARKERLRRGSYHGSYLKFHMQDPCPLGLPEMWSVAQMALRTCYCLDEAFQKLSARRDQRHREQSSGACQDVRAPGARRSGCDCSQGQETANCRLACFNSALPWDITKGTPQFIETVAWPMILQCARRIGKEVRLDVDVAVSVNWGHLCGCP